MKFNSKTKFLFPVKMHTVGNSVSEKLDCAKKIEEIVKQANGTAKTFESLPYSKGGRYKRNTSTLTDILTFEFDKEENTVRDLHASNSANRPTFNVEVYSDKWLQKKYNELQGNLQKATDNLNIFIEGIGAETAQKAKEEQEKHAEIAAKIQREKDEKETRFNKELSACMPFAELRKAEILNSKRLTGAAKAAEQMGILKSILRDANIKEASDFWKLWRAISANHKTEK